MMLSEPGIRFVLVAGVWTCWCAIHSLLNSNSLLGKPTFQRPWIRSYYRLIYCVLAVVTLTAAIRITPRENEVLLWRWEWPYQILQVFLLAAAVALLYASFRLLDVWDFLGLRAPGLMKRLERTEQDLVTTGIYGWIRHPQFAAVLLGVWARDLRDTDIVINAVLSIYAVAGAHIEERRLLESFGDRYARYMESVPRFIPKLSALVRSESDDEDR